jgi:dihydrofolate reductase
MNVRTEKETKMRQVVVQAWMTLDAVVQAPGDPEEDTSDGFEHGGWSLPYFEELGMKWAVENLTGASGYLLGRRTYEGFASHWPDASPEEQPLAEPLNTKPKYVASTTLAEPLAWENASLLQGDVADAVRKLKQEDGTYLLAIGSAGLVQTLIERDLVDEFRLMIDPLMVGGGKRLFPDDRVLRNMTLLDSQVTSSGAILTTYGRD